ncbi:ABC transporter ATP-binding protein [Bifidobacterium sp. B4107]|uniref:ABC transporter ATP-binding protein n=1 Tax=unclassified Bifidobacterium TaxID=2608897 RepID=UPI00226B1728|nr:MULTISPECIES: ABC transporter ATP-binding protein [unclassified Bifidobacterium]MCX8647167.1 ABC transporter ATP-binding protein [Bifidobacterium sp. B4107]MCX8651347.1 ABC transporter ATP-binding protein [Bifidobacterium sp. B4111]MCX8657777.1 ABC transporter ATP-binding protein [Bifidobacterium sp. B4114]
MDDTILDISHVSKRFGRFQAVEDLSLSINRGEIYGLIGENGAGKTTLMRLITGLSPMQKGTIRLMGRTIGKNRRILSRIGSIIEAPAAFKKLTVSQNMKLTAIQHGLADDKAISQAIDFVGLGEKAKTRAAHLSLGQRQRLGLAMAILTRPDFLILDEPINGLDPAGIIEFRTLLGKLNKERQTTILISSHILSELYLVSSRFGFISHGRLIKEVDKDELDRINQNGLLIDVDQSSKAATIMDRQGIGPFQVLDDHQILIRQGNLEPGSINSLLVQKGILVNQISQQKGSLEGYFADLLNKDPQKSRRQQ